MKKILSIILAVCIFALASAGCTTESQADTNTKSYTTDGKVTKMVADEEASGELTVSYVINSEDANAAALTFNRLYPNVKLNLQGIGKESYIDYSARLKTEIMAGVGPDLLGISSGFDVNKMTRSGVFADMHDYFENDENFNIDDYNKAVFCGGQSDGKQYIIPIRYNIPLVMTTKSIAKESGFNASKCTDYLSFIKETEKAFLKLNNAREMKLFGEPYALTLFPQYSGFNWINYNDGTVKIDTDEFKDVIEFTKTYFKNEMSEWGFASENSYKSVLALKSKENMLADFCANGGGRAFVAMRLLLYYEEEPVAFAWKNANGKINATSVECVAVRSNSENKQNAYNFIKALLSPEVQNGDSLNDSTIPISNIAMNQLMGEHKKEMIVGFGEETGIITLPALPQSYIDEYFNMLKEVEAVEYHGPSEKLFKKAMLPYFKNEKPYDECIKNAQEALEIYVSE